LRIVIPTTGSLGDVQPYLALGLGLQAAGHQVCLATHADFAPLVRGRGLEFFPIAGSSRAWHASEAGQKMLATGANPFAFIRQYARMRQPLWNELMAGGWQACHDADLVVVATTGFLLGHTLAEKRQVPAVAAHYVPATLNRSLANCLFPSAPAWLPGGGAYNYLSHVVAAEIFWQMQREAVNRARREVLGMPPYPFFGPPAARLGRGPGLYGYSPRVVPRPHDWNDNQCVTGYWFLGRPKGWRPAAGLVDFLQSGPPPVVVGFGSMHSRDAQRVTDLVVRALDRCRLRGVLLTGWGGLDDSHQSDRFYVTRAVPHDWLFPRTAAVVHHGGAGTTAAALRAGIPSVVVPFMADQPFWGRQILRLGVGPRPIPYRQLTVPRLAAALKTALGSPAIRRRAAALGRAIRTEDGVASAVEMFHRFLPAPAGWTRDHGRPFPGGLRRKEIFLPQGATVSG
jgi:UDP:flavonoid glycosyltransferase YjiC (YdhE family)